MNYLYSVSGGRTSGYMASLAKELHPDDNVLFIFANTGKEDEETLIFLDKCDKQFNLNLVWVEAVVNPLSGVGTTYKVVDFNTAARDGRPFKDVIEKYGIPNKAYPHCNRELKLAPIHKYAKDFFKGDKYKTAIGIRTDESRRVSAKADVAHGGGIIYPLIDLVPTDKQDVNSYWEDMPFNLNLPEHRGNCVTCWKKSDRKLFTLIKEDEKAFDFFREMEKLHKFSGSNDGINGRVFFRKNRSYDDLYAEYLASDFESFVDPRFNKNLDLNGGCSESCELYETE